MRQLDGIQFNQVQSNQINYTTTAAVALAVGALFSPHSVLLTAAGWGVAVVVVLVIGAGERRWGWVEWFPRNRHQSSHSPPAILCTSAAVCIWTGWDRGRSRCTG